MRESLIRTGLFAGVIAVALAVVLIGNEPKGMNPAEIDSGDVQQGEWGTIAPDVQDFKAVELNVPAKIDFTVGKDYAVSIAGDKAILARLEARLRDGTLQIRTRDRQRIRNHRKIKITLSAPELSAVTINGAADGRIAGLAGDRFVLTINGAGNLKLLGRCDSFSLTINGAADVTADKLLCQAVTATINGAGDAEVYASERLTAAINGAGNITVHGNPKTVHSNKVGFGRIDILSDARTED